MKPVNVLMVEDSEDDAKLALRALRQGGFEPTSRRVQTAAELEAALAGERWDAVISDFNMPGFTGMDALRIFRTTGLDIPFILVSGNIGEETAVDAMQAGASDYVMKQSLTRLAPALERELKETRMRAAHRQAQQDLSESEQRFRQMAENIRDVFFLADADTRRMLYINPAYERIWGRSRESLYAHPESWTESIHPDDRASTYEKYKNGMSAGKFQYEYRIVRPDGAIRSMEVRGFPIRDNAGKVVRITGIVADITERKHDEEASRRFRTAMDATADAIVLVNRTSMRFVEVNATACTMFGYSREELLQMGPTQLGAAPLEQVEMAHDAIIAGHGTYELTETQLRRKDGSQVQVEVRRHAQRSGADWIIVGVVRDITERKKSEERIRRLNRVQAVLSGIDSLIVRVHDREELFTQACRIAVEHGQFHMAWIGVVDRSAMKIVPIASAGAEPAFLTLIENHFSLREDAPMGNTLSARAVREKKAMVSNDIRDDPRIPFAQDRIKRGISSIAVVPLLVADDVVAVLALYSSEAGFFDEQEMRLLTELAGDIAFAIDHLGKQARLDYLAYYDVLTGFANRALFHERLQLSVVNAREQGRKVSLVLLDIERFRTINDTLGRQAGDALLNDVAARILERTVDAGRLGRLDADHFAVMVLKEQTGEELGRLVEQRFAEIFSSPFRIGASEVRLFARFGIAMFPSDGADADTLFRNAEAALKNAKASGERYLFYTQSMNDRVAEKLSLESRLRQALDQGEFVLHYQPKVNLASGKVTSAEALIRWNDPRTGLVPPGRFIPVLEETGLIHEVGRWALRQAIEDYLRWRAAGPAAVRIAVNVSPLQLRHRGFIDEIRQVIGIDAHAAAGLELELTESLIMADVTHSIASLQAIRAMGVTIAIDDFGTGFSSLSYLAKLPLDTLKIDRSFVIDMTAGPEGLALVSTIISLAHSLKLKVVAEGVETEEQSHLLRLLGSDEMQGFLFSKPVPAELFEAKFLAPSRGA